MKKFIKIFFTIFIITTIFLPAHNSGNGSSSPKPPIILSK